MKKILWIFFVLLCILVGVYPLISIVVDGYVEIFGPKSDRLFSGQLYFISFYIHVTLGGLALTIGWIQFFEKLRTLNVTMHKSIGRLYVFSVIISAFTGIYIALFAFGGMISSLGFIGLALAWLYTTLDAYRFARLRQIFQHKRMMYYSYAVTFSAVTFRILNPLLAFILDERIIAYQISAWLCWVVNLLVAYLIVQKIEA